jgi:hypothetical protein
VLCICGHPQLTLCVDTLEWLPEKAVLVALDEALSGPSWGNASVPCLVYLLAMVSYRPSDSRWHLEPRRGWVIGFASMGNEVDPQRLVNLLNNFQLRKDRLPAEYKPPENRPGLQVTRSPRGR